MPSFSLLSSLLGLRLRWFLWLLPLGLIGLRGPALRAQAPMPATPAISADEQQGIDSSIARHFGDAPQNPGPKPWVWGTSRPASVRHAMKKVADWELNRSQPYFDRTWTWSTLYAGFLAASRTLNDPRYRDAMEAFAEHNQWQLLSAVPDADDQSLAQTYLELDMLDPSPDKVLPTRTALDALAAGANAPFHPDQAQITWWWCDALFMGPPVWARMYAVTHDTKYLDYIDKHWHETSDLLYDRQRHLYYRDQNWLHQTDSQGKPIFWSRGNGWVMAGLARTLEYIPVSDPRRDFYENQLREMAAAIVQLQNPYTGLWHSSLLEPMEYPQPEVSGSALITYALAWGVNQGILDRKTYLLTVQRAWRGLVKQVYADGRLGNVQQTGVGPAHYLPSSSYNYGVGAFLLAGEQVAALPRTAKRKPR